MKAKTAALSVVVFSAISMLMTLMLTPLSQVSLSNNSRYSLTYGDIVTLQNAKVQKCEESGKLSLQADRSTHSANRLGKIIASKSIKQNDSKSDVVPKLTLLVKYDIPHFPHVAQNLFYLLGVLFDSGMSAANILLHGPRIGPKKGSIWLSHIVKAMNMTILNDENPSIQTLFQSQDEIGRVLCKSPNGSDSVQFEELIMRTRKQPIWFPSEASCKFFRDSILSFYTINDFKKSTKKDILFVDRHVSRKIVNKKELIQALVALGYQIKEEIFEGKGLSDQIRTLSRSSIVIMVHGAALTNIVFMHSQAVVIEVFPYNYAPSFDWYTGLARSCGLISMPLMAHNASDFEQGCREFSGFSSSSCMSNKFCRSCARSRNVWIKVEELTGLIIHLS